MRDRYLVTDPLCHFVGSEDDKESGLRHARAHSEGCIGVTVYDRAAHKGAPHEWTPAGTIICWRDRKDQWPPCDHNPEPTQEDDMTTKDIEIGEDFQCGWTAPSGDICESVSWHVLRFTDGVHIVCIDCGEPRKVTIEPIGCYRCGQPLLIGFPPEYTKSFDRDGRAFTFHAEPDRPCYEMAVAGADMSACFDCWDADLSDYGCKWETHECPCDCHADEKRPITEEMQDAKHYPGDGCVEKESEGKTAAPQNCHHCGDPLTISPHRAIRWGDNAFWYHDSYSKDCYAASFPKHHKEKH